MTYSSSSVRHHVPVGNFSHRSKKSKVCTTFFPIILLWLSFPCLLMIYKKERVGPCFLNLWDFFFMWLIGSILSWNSHSLLMLHCLGKSAVPSSSIHTVDVFSVITLPYHLRFFWYYQESIGAVDKHSSFYHSYGLRFDHYCMK